MSRRTKTAASERCAGSGRARSWPPTTGRSRTRRCRSSRSGFAAPGGGHSPAGGRGVDVRSGLDGRRSSPNAVAPIGPMARVVGRAPTIPIDAGGRTRGDWPPAPSGKERVPMASIRIPAALATASILLAAASAHAQTATAGTPVSDTHLADESHAGVLADGTGGAYVGYKIAYRSASFPAEIAVARVLPSAGRHPDWSPLPMTPAGSLAQTNPPGPSRLLRAPQGEVLAFADFGTTSTPQDVVRERATLGADPADPGFKPSYSYNVFNVVSRSDGGALILSKALGSINLLATVVSPSGAGTEVFTPLSLSNGVTATLGGDRLAAVPSGVDGGIAVILLPQINLSATGIDMVAVRVDGTGHPVWLPAHRVVTSAPRDQMEEVAVSDGADGVIIAWRDDQNIPTGSDIYTVRLLSTGAVATGWGGGKTIAMVAGAQYAPSIASDDAGGAWFAWVDERNLMLGGTDIYISHLLANGTLAAGFVANGRALCDQPGDQTAVQLARDGSGGCFAVWLDARDGEADLYAQHLNAAGDPTAHWAAGGTAVCTDGTAQELPAIDLVSTGRAITAWNDRRTGASIVYAAALDAGLGVLAVPRDAGPRLALAPVANPARDALELRLDAADAGDVRVTLFDVSGRVRAERTLAGPARERSLRFVGLPPGLYLARASQSGSTTLTRVAVLR